MRPHHAIKGAVAIFWEGKGNEMLEFPTMAERAIEDWRACTSTTAFNTIARKRGATRDDEFGVIVWIFDDDTKVRISGRGSRHKIEAELP